ncbi:unnamed protein product, partial [Closterium sp. NIES-53]
MVEQEAQAVADGLAGDEEELIARGDEYDVDHGSDDGDANDESDEGDDGDEDEDLDDDDDGEAAALFGAQQKPHAINDAPALRRKLDEFAWAGKRPWVESLAVIVMDDVATDAAAGGAPCGVEA